MKTNPFHEKYKWLPSFSLFGRGELVIHTPPQNQSQQGKINRVKFNPCYPQQDKLATYLGKELCSLVAQLNIKNDNHYEVKIDQLLNMMAVMLATVKENTQAYHNIIYLTLKYLAYYVTQQAKRDGQMLEDQVSLTSWLGDIHSIYYQNNVHSNKDVLTKKDELEYLFKRGTYEQMLPILKTIYCKLDEEEDLHTMKKIDAIIGILLIKIYEQAEGNEDVKNIQKMLMKKKKLEEYRGNIKLSKAYQISNKDKEKGTIEIIGEILFGEETSLQLLAQGSWPVYLIHQINLQEMIKNNQNKEIRQIIQKYIKKSKNYGKSTGNQVKYYLSLLTQPNLHSIYQSLQALIPPFYSHFFAFLLNIISPDPSPSIFVEDYYTDIVRNLLYHASEISFDCLMNIVATLQESNFVERRIQMYQPLFYHHLVVIDPLDRNELNEFIKKIKTLQLFHLESHASFQLNSLLPKLLQSGYITRESLLIYCFCSLMYKSYYNYEQLLAYHLQEIYSNFQFNINFLSQYQNLKKQLASYKVKDMYNELDQVKHLFDRFYLYQKIIKTQTQNENLFLLLMQKTYRSLRLLQLIHHKVHNITTSLNTTMQQQNTEQVFFLNNVKQFLIHYPLQSSQKQKILVDSTLKMIV